MDKGAGWATIHGVAKSDTTKGLTFSATYLLCDDGKVI